MKTLFLIALTTLFCAPMALAVEPVEIRYTGKIEIRSFEAGKPYLTNRKYLLKKVPPELSGMKFTALAGNAYTDFEARVAKGSVVYLALDDGKKSPATNALHEYSNSLDRDGWKYFGRILVSDERMETLRVLVKTFKQDETVAFKGVGFVGSIVIAPALEIGR
jgi:hypothetical protein